MTKILGIMGRAFSGKTSASNFIHGHIIKSLGKTKRFELDESGYLLLEMDRFDADNNFLGQQLDYCDVNRRDVVFESFAVNTVWKYVKSYTFSEPLKDMCINVFGLTYEQCYGKDKNEYSDITWGQFSPFLTPQLRKNVVKEKEVETFNTIRNEPLTARECMEYFAECFCRRIDPYVFINRCLERIDNDETPLSTIHDVRKADECRIIQDRGGKVIRLTRSFDTKLSEDTIDDCEANAVIDNQDLSMEETHQLILKYLVDWKFVKNGD